MIYYTALIYIGAEIIEEGCAIYSRVADRREGLLVVRLEYRNPSNAGAFSWLPLSPNQASKLLSVMAEFRRLRPRDRFGGNSSNIRLIGEEPQKHLLTTLP